MTKNVIWFSRHELTEEQIEGLKKVLQTNVVIKNINKTISTAKEILNEVDENTNLVAVVLPVALLAELKAILPENVIVAVPRNKRIKSETGEFVFAYDGWEIVKVCKYESELIK